MKTTVHRRASTAALALSCSPLCAAPAPAAAKLAAEKVDAVLGRIRFDARGDAEGVGFALCQVREAAHVAVR